MYKCYVYRTTHNGSILSLPENLLNQLNLKANEMVTLKCGSLETKTRICQLSSVGPVNIHAIGLSSDCLTSLQIPENIRFKIKSLAEKVLRLGPVIGILTFPGHLKNRLSYYGCYARRNRNNGLLYVFRGRGINPGKKIVSGFYLDPVSNTWKQRDFPFPDTVIDRLYPNSRISHTLLEKEIGPSKIFNKKSMINKVDFFTALCENNYLNEHTPETRIFKNPSDLEYFLNKYEEVYLKPFNAMKGFGIVVVKKYTDGSLDCSYSLKGETLTTRISSPAGIYDILINAAGRRRSYIIQQGIPRLEYHGGAFSIRPWAMKNGKGRWILPGMFAKGTLGKGFLTNFTAGASLIPMPELIKELVPNLFSSKVQFTSLIEDLTLKAAEALDRKYGPLGELGMDVVFDKSGKPWLIEANGNPGNIPIFRQKEYPVWRTLVFQLPLDYATYLAGFTKPE